MRIGIYSEPQGEVGGSEFCVAVLAEALHQSHEVEIVTHRERLAIKDFSQRFGTQLAGVKLRYVPATERTRRSMIRPWQSFKETKEWHADLSEPYDLFVNFTHGLPPFCHAPAGVLVILFPWSNRYQEWPWQLDGKPLRKPFRQFYDNWVWERRFATYQAKIAISRFSQEYAKTWWGLDCQIIYPPADPEFGSKKKIDAILSVGRFATLGHSKKQLEMVTAFRQMQDSTLSNWNYHCVGGLGISPADAEYFERVRLQAGRANVVANLEYGKLRSLFEQSKIFWHAAGYGEDEHHEPQLSEHFGIATVEAMAAGCVPVVINKGGQAEIVQHGVSGFLWNTLDELKEYTTMLSRDERLREQMSHACRARAKCFGKDVFTDSFSKILNPLMKRCLVVRGTGNSAPPKIANTVDVLLDRDKSIR